MRAGLVLVTLGVLSPVASGRLSTKDLLGSVFGLEGLSAVAGGLIVTILSGRGLPLLNERPDLLGAILLGALIAALFFGGVPIGPLVAAGVASVVMAAVRK